MDPRLILVDERCKDIKRLLVVTGGKGGIGKSMTASMMALTLSDMGYKVGLLDLDFCGPSAHTILGIEGVYPEEEKGIIPPEICGIRFMSIIYYAGDNPSPLRGIDISNAIIELFAITRWGSLDFLVIDMPPGIGDATLDTFRLLKKSEYLVVATPSKVVLDVVDRTLGILKEMRLPVIGVLENMKTADSSCAAVLAEKFDVPFLGVIGFDKDIEGAVGDRDRLLDTDFVRSLKKIVSTRPEFKL